MHFAGGTDRGRYINNCQSSLSQCLPMVEDISPIFGLSCFLVAADFHVSLLTFTLSKIHIFFYLRFGQNEREKIQHLKKESTLDRLFGSNGIRDDGKGC